MFGSMAESTGILEGLLHPSLYVKTAWGVILFLAIVSFLGTRNMEKVPRGLQNILEMAVEGLYNFIGGIVGEKKAPKYFPFIATFFLFILISNYVGLLPFSGHEGPYIPPTSTISVTAALAIIVFFAIHVFGISEKGLGYFKHFITPFVFMLPLNILEQLVRPLSLSMRLYGNIYGHELVVGTFMGLVPMLIPVVFNLLGVLTGAIQAIVFTLLTSSYIGEAVHDEHH